jgi:hypothetical protein
MTGTMPMYYVTAPNETGRLIQSMLNRELTEEPLISIAPTLPADGLHATHIPKKIGEIMEKSESQKRDEKIGSKDVSYDVKGTVRDVLR